MSHTKRHRRLMMFEAVPPSIIPTWMVVNGGSNGRADGLSDSARAISSSFETSCAAVITALTPRWVWLEWASWAGDHGLQSR